MLLLADEQEEMIDRYIGRGAMYVLDDNGVKAECIVCDEGNGVLEIKSLAVLPKYQKKGLGKQMIAFVERTYRDSFSVLRVGTGESLRTLSFYKKCGFEECSRVKDFFTLNYDHEIIEDGVVLKDMVILQKQIS